MSISKNHSFDHLNPSPFSKREGYMEFLEMPVYQVQFKIFKNLRVIH